MIDELNQAVQAYDQKWQTLLKGRKNADFFSDLKQTAVGWKTTDREEYDRLLALLRAQADLVIDVWMNGRWIAKVHLKDQTLVNGVQIVKLMERRPGSTDAVGLDHVDFYTPTELPWNKEILESEPDLKWSQESNDVIDGYDWLSVWFADTEAKIKSDTILDILQVELKQLNEKIIH